MTSKRQKPKPTKKTPGTLLGERMRAEGNKLSNVQRENLGPVFMRLYYGPQVQAGLNSSPLSELP